MNIFRCDLRTKSFLGNILQNRGGRGDAPLLAAALLLAGPAAAQLVVAPGRTAATASSGLANPYALAYDAAGDLFIADTNNHQVRKLVKSSGNTIVVAGSGVAGYTGDGGSAVAAQLDTPTGVAVDSAGAVYVADSHNNVVRKISGGIITTAAGNGTRGFSGDGAAATAATLALPSAVAVDGSGNFYIADTNNHRIRKVTGTTISTVVGTGEEYFAGDGGAATAASLDSPTGIAVDASGVLYIADRRNSRIRAVTAAGIITTLAGNGNEGYSGDGATATAAALAKPTGVSVDSKGNVFVADTNNQRIRQVGSAGIATVQGTGEQGLAGDGGSALASTLNAPRAVTTDTTGNLAVADTLDGRVRTDALPTLTYATQGVGTVSAAQSLTLSNSGAAPLILSQITASTGFATAAGGSCSSPPIIIAAGASCTLNVVYSSAASGTVNGSITLAGANVPQQTVLLQASATSAATSLALVSSGAAPLINQSVTFTATVTAQTGSGIPTGTVVFTSNGLLLGNVTLVNGTASVSNTFFNAGTYSIQAVYSGDANYVASTVSLSQLIGDFSFTLTPDPTTGSGTSSDYSISVLPGAAATYGFSVQPLNGPFTFPISLSATGLPPGATATFNPQTFTIGANAVKFTMTIQTAKTTGLLRTWGAPGGAALAVLLLPFAGRMRRRSRSLARLTMLLASFASLAAVTALSGCGSTTGFFGQASSVYTVNVVATAQGSSGATVQHVASVKLVVQ